MDITGKGLAKFATSKIGTPYVYGAKGADGPLTQDRVNWLARNYPNIFTSIYLKKIRDRGYVGKVCCDCSGLISWYTGKVLGSAQLYSKAYARLPMNQLSKFAVGTVLYRKGHVGVYAGLNSKGQHILIEAKGIDSGTVASIVNPSKWACGLTFSWINYTIDYPIDSKEISYKGNNPYTKPTRNLKAGLTGEDIKWLQFELIEAGYGYDFSYNNIVCKAIVISGVFDKSTKYAVLDFQRSSKLEVDGIVGPKTINALVSNTAPVNIDPNKNTYPIPTKNVRFGNKGSDVLWLQTQLNIKGYKCDINGLFDTKTSETTKQFQKDHKLVPDGIVGTLTRTELLK